MWDLLFHPSIFLAGLWTAYWPLIASTVVITVLLILAYSVPLGKRYFVEAAILVGISMAVYSWALHNADERCRAQNVAGTKVINKVVNKAVKKTHTRKAIATPDPWNQRNY